MQLDVHVDGSGQENDVVEVDDARTSVGPDMRQVEDLESRIWSANSLV